MTRVDLHCHSLCSDGTEEPAVVAAKAIAAGVTTFCLTDHDTADGSAAAAAVIEAAGARAIRGMELSCMHAGRSVHVLLYGLREGAASLPLEIALAALRDRRRDRVREICARLAAIGVCIDADAVLAAAGDATAGRPHVARALVDAGACKSTHEAFDRFLGDGRPGDVPVAALEVGEGLALGRAAGARMALAHPHRLGPDVTRAIVKRYREAGLEGLEAQYGPYPLRVRADWTDLADELRLVVTAGSDYHGPGVLPAAERLGVDVTEARAQRFAEWVA